MDYFRTIHEFFSELISRRAKVQSLSKHTVCADSVQSNVADVMAAVLPFHIVISGCVPTPPPPNWLCSNYTGSCVNASLQRQRGKSYSLGILNLKDRPALPTLALLVHFIGTCVNRGGHSYSTPPEVFVY